MGWIERQNWGNVGGNRDGPADVAEILTQKYEGEKREECLKRLVEALEKTKKEAEKKKGWSRKNGRRRERRRINEIKSNGVGAKEVKERKWSHGESN